jgi:hypothetical protein
MTINGSNVTADNIEDGYIQFILHHDPDSIGDGIEGLMYIRRKFTSVPRTGDLSYTTWDIFVLVNKLHNRQVGKHGNVSTTTHSLTLSFR